GPQQELHRGRAMAPRIPPARLRHHRRFGVARRFPDCRRRGQTKHPRMNTLAIHNPATGALIAELPADDAASVAAKAAVPRAAQPRWAAVPMAERLACIARFRAGVVRDLESLAVTMTRETGKPIKMSRNELNGLLGRLDFFMQQAQHAVATETVHDEGGM